MSQGKEIYVDENRYVICLNPQQAKKVAEAREAIFNRLEVIITHGLWGPKAVIGNKGYARFLKVHKAWVTVETDKRLGGKFVLLKTNTSPPAPRWLRTTRACGMWSGSSAMRRPTLQVRPLYHHRDETCIGHVVASFIVLRLEVDLQTRLERKGIESSGPNLMRDLRQP